MFIRRSWTIAGTNRNIRALRLEAQLTQQELAQRGGCSLSYVQMLEAGYAPKRSDVLARIAEVLDAAEQAGDVDASALPPAIPSNGIAPVAHTEAIQNSAGTGRRGTA